VFFCRFLADELLQHLLTIACNDNSNAYISHLLYYSITSGQRPAAGQASRSGNQWQPYPIMKKEEE